MLNEGFRWSNESLMVLMLDIMKHLPVYNYIGDSCLGVWDYYFFIIGVGVRIDFSMIDIEMFLNFMEKIVPVARGGIIDIVFH